MQSSHLLEQHLERARKSLGVNSNLLSFEMPRIPSPSPQDGNDVEPCLAQNVLKTSTNFMSQNMTSPRMPPPVEKPFT